jgi:hypothetical protein
VTIAGFPVFFIPTSLIIREIISCIILRFHAALRFCLPVGFWLDVSGAVAVHPRLVAEALVAVAVVAALVDH